MSGSKTQPDFAFEIGETVEVTLTGRIIERKESADGKSYWIEQDLPNGRTARQSFKEINVFEVDK